MKKKWTQQRKSFGLVLTNSRTQKTAIARSESSSRSWTPWQRMRGELDTRQAIRRANRLGVLPLLNLVLAGHPYAVEDGRLWVWVDPPQ